MKRNVCSRLGSLSIAISCFVVDLAGISTDLVQAQTGTFIDRHLATDLRVMSYNVLWDTIFPERDPVKAAKFSRVINALNPDLLNLQEIGDPFTPGWEPRDATDVRNLLNTIAPLNGGATSWNVYMGGDNVIASKYPLTLGRTNTSPVGDKPQAIALVDLPDDQFPADFYLMNNHFKCCGGSSGDEEQRRQRQADGIVNWLEDARNPGGAMTLAPGTPFAVVGDLNIVGTQIPLNTVITGNIVNNSTYGIDSPPDWDGTSLTDANPVHNGAGSTRYTYRSGSTQSRLDYIIYSDSALDAANKFVLNTVSMSSAQRTATGLLQYDTAQGNSSTRFDHLPVVTDFRLFDFAEADFNFNRIVDATDLATWQTSYGMTSGATRAMGDANGDGRIDGRDFLTWQRQSNGGSPALSAVPEPTCLGLFLVAFIVVPLSRKRPLAA
jgi:endonuclease/exonuclease/phosphatase family metal-dependent hydrolase